MVIRTDQAMAQAMARATAVHTAVWAWEAMAVDTEAVMAAVMALMDPMAV